MKRTAAFLTAGGWWLLATVGAGASTEKSFSPEKFRGPEPVLEAIAFNAVQEAPKEESLEPAPLPVLEKAVREIQH